MELIWRQLYRRSEKPIEGPRSTERFSPPMLLVRERMDLPHAIWKKTYLTYKNQIFGFAAPEKQLSVIEQIDDWLAEQSSIIRAVRCLR